MTEFDATVARKGSEVIVEIRDRDTGSVRSTAAPTKLMPLGRYRVRIDENDGYHLVSTRPSGLTSSQLAYLLRDIRKSVKKLQVDPPETTT